MQKYSVSQQATFLTAYAAAHAQIIVRSYIDDGRSGLTLAARPGLQALLADVVDEKADFSRILVLDVSRWGRFQDPDEAAHYEYLCQEGGVAVDYCHEAFENGPGAMAALVKTIKRVMAAEFSRELSTKILHAQKHQAALGFRMGAPLPYGLIRVVVDHQGNPKTRLAKGQYKALRSDRVVLEWAGPDAKRHVRRIFRDFLEGVPRSEIARRLNARGVVHTDGGEWTDSKVHTLLRSELVIGDYVFNRRGRRLRSPRFDNAPDLWVRTRVVEPIIDAGQFQRVQMKLARRRMGRRSDQDLLEDLGRLLAENGKLSKQVINATPGMASAQAYARRFGSIFAAYDAVGYKPFDAPNWTRDRTDDELISDLRRALRENPRLGVADINVRQQLPHASTYVKRFGSLAKAYALAGYEPPDTDPAALRWRYHRGSVLRFTDNELLAPLRALLAEHGYLSGTLVSQCQDCPSRRTYAHRFGGMLEAFRQVGYSTTAAEVRRSGLLRRNARKRSEGSGNEPNYADEILAQLKVLYAREGLLSSRLVDADPDLPSPSTVARVFGKLSKAFQLAGCLKDIEATPTIRLGHHHKVDRQ